MVRMVSKPTCSSPEHSLNTNSVKIHYMGNFGSRFKLGVDEVWLNQYLTVC